jgi:hypothetical protein
VGAGSPPSEARLAALVGDRRDGLLIEVARALAEGDHPTVWLDPDALASTPCTLSPRGVRVAGVELHAVLFRARPHRAFADGFRADDLEFASAEARAVWLAALALTSVAAPNRFSAEEWYSSAEWPIWRRRFDDAGVPTAPALGGAPGDEVAWLPYSSSGRHAAPGPATRAITGATLVEAGALSSSVVCLGAVIEGPDTEPVRRAAAVMEDHGSRLVGIVADEEGRILLATAHPEVARDTARRAAAMIAEEVHAHPARR